MEEKGKKRKKKDQDQQKSKKIKTEEEKPSGLKNSMHGNVYQLMVLILVLRRALKSGIHKFKLSTEDPEAEKFDDLVLECFEKDEDGNENNFFRFLQAKHKLDELKEKITFSSLVTEDPKGEFGLQKYFKSFISMKRNPKFEGKIKDLIIFTNIDLDVEDLNVEGVRAVPTTEPDEILDLQTDLKTGKKYKLDVDPKSKLWKKLNGTSDLHEIAKSIATCLNKRLPFVSNVFCYLFVIYSDICIYRPFCTL